MIRFMRFLTGVFHVRWHVKNMKLIITIKKIPIIIFLYFKYFKADKIIKIRKQRRKRYHLVRTMGVLSDGERVFKVMGG